MEIFDIDLLINNGFLTLTLKDNQVGGKSSRKRRQYVIGEIIMTRYGKRKITKKYGKLCVRINNGYVSIAKAIIKVKAHGNMRS